MKNLSKAYKDNYDNIFSEEAKNRQKLIEQELLAKEQQYREELERKELIEKKKIEKMQIKNKIKKLL